MRLPLVNVFVVTYATLALGACRDSMSPESRVAAIEVVSLSGPTVDIGASVSPIFRVVDREGRPVAGVTVEFYSRSGRYDRYEALSDHDGLASPGRWYPTFVGANEMWVRVYDITAAIMLTGVCQPVTLQLPALVPPTDTRITGELNDTGCTYDPGEGCYFCWEEYAAIHRFTTTATRQINMRLGSSASGYVSFVTTTLRDAAGTERGSAESHGMGTGWPLSVQTIGPGTYTIEVRGTDATYTLDLLGCQMAGLARGSKSGSLDSGDCTRGAPEAALIDRYLMYIEPGSPVTITMASSDFDALLELTMVQSYPDAPNIDAIVASNDNAVGTDARVTYSCPREYGCAVQVTAASARPGGRGAYTLTVE